MRFFTNYFNQIKILFDQIEEFIKIRKYEIMKILKKIKNLFVFNFRF